MAFVLKNDSEDDQPFYFMNVNERRKRHPITKKLETVSNWSGDVKDATVFPTKQEAENVRDALEDEGETDILIVEANAEV